MKISKKFKQVLLTVVPLTVLSTLPLLSARCDKTNYNMINKRLYIRTLNANLQKQAWINDASRTFGAMQDNLSHHFIGGLLVRKSGLNEPTIETLKLPTGPVSKISKPTFYKNKLEYVKEFILTIDGEQKIYDNDEAEILPEGTEEINGKKYYTDISVQALSKNAKSINNPEFYKDLEKASKLQFTLKEDVYWSDYKGQKTKYKINPKDVYYSWLRTVTLNRSLRYNPAYGGSEALDKLIHDNLLDVEASDLTKNEQGYSNEYLYGIFNVNSANFYKEDKFITDATINSKQVKAITIDKKDASKKADFKNFFISCLLTGQDFILAPSEYIDDVNANGIKAYSYKGLAASPSINAQLEAIKDKVFGKIGGYWYGIHEKTTLFAGPYYALEITGTDKDFKLNENYWDQEWVKSTNKINEIIWRYASSTTQTTDEFAKNNFINYQQFATTEADYSLLTPANKTIVNKNVKKYGLRQLKPSNKLNPRQRFITTSHLNLAVADSKFLNDAYLKISYNVTKDDIKNGKQSLSDYLSNGPLSFRSILNAAVNWDAFTNTLTNNIGRPWLVKLAEDGAIGGSDQNTASHTTFKSFYNEINSLFAFDKDGNKIEFSKTKDRFQISPEDNQKSLASAAKVIDQYKSAGFDELKQKLAELIADFDEKNPTLKGQNFEYTWFFQYVNVDPNLEVAMNSLCDLYAELNPRLKYKFVSVKDGNDPDLNAVRNKDITGQTFASWSYDFDLSASGFDSLSWNGSLLSILTSLEDPANAALKAKFENIFPEMAKAAAAFKAYGIANPWNVSVPVDKLHLVEPTQYKDFRNDGYNYVWKLQDGKYVRDGDNEYPDATEIYGYSAKFWLNYTGTQTNENIMKLVNELATFFRIDPQTGHNVISKSEYTPFLLNKFYHRPIITGEVLHYSDVKVDKAPNEKK